MPDEPNEAEQNNETQGPNNESVTVTKEELQQFQNDQARLKKMDDIAQDMMGGDTEDYLSALESDLHAANQQPTPKKTPPAAPPANAAAARIQQLEEQVTTLAQNTSAAQIESQWGTFQGQQSALPKEDKSSLTRAEALKLMKGPAGPLAREMVLADSDGEFGGNLFSALASYQQVKQGKKELRKAGAKSEEALNNAKETASLQTGGVPIPASGSEEEQMNEYAAHLSPADPEIE